MRNEFSVFKSTLQNLARQLTKNKLKVISLRLSDELRSTRGGGRKNKTKDIYYDGWNIKRTKMYNVCAGI